MPYPEEYSGKKEHYICGFRSRFRHPVIIRSFSLSASLQSQSVVIFFEGDDGDGDDRAPFANLAPRDNFFFPAARHFFFPSHESGARSKSTNLDGA